MDILRTWIDKNSKQERAKLYRNIDPESIAIVGLTIYFAHEGVHKRGDASTHGHYQIPISGCPFFLTDPELIKQEMTRFDFTGDLGLCNQTAELKGVNMFYDLEHDTYISRDELQADYEYQYKSGDTDTPTFEQYIRNCLDSGNLEIMEV